MSKVHQKIACLGYESLIHTFLIIHNNSVLLRAKLAKNQSDNQVLSYLLFLPIMPIAHLQNMSEYVSNNIKMRTKTDYNITSNEY